MAIFNNENSVKEQSLEQLTATLSDSQLKVARTNYRTVMQELTKTMDINNPELKKIVSHGVIERIKMYEM